VSREVPRGAVRSVGELITQRSAAGSEPGRRDDKARLALVVEGGSSRGAYSHGMAVALEDLGVLNCFDAVYGSSAGALNGAWLLCGRAGEGLRAWNSAVIRRVISPARAVIGGPVVDTGYLVDTVYERVVPMDFPAILANTVSFHPLATDADTCASVDLRPYITEVMTLKTALRATICLPILVGKPVQLGDRRFVDSGISESVPVRTALAQGATHLLVLRTRRADETVTVASAMERRVVSRFLSRYAPGAVEPWLDRVERHAGEERLIVGNPALTQIRPPLGAPDIGRIERDSTVLRRAIAAGRAAAMDVIAPYVATMVSE